MKLNKLILFPASLAFAAGIAILSKNSSFGTLNSSEIQKAMAESKAEKKAKSIQGALESIYSMRLNEQTGTLEPEWFEAATKQANALKVSNRGSKLAWENLGPDNIGGRTRAFLLHRDSAHFMFVGSVSGGLFRSNTTGQSWFPVNDLASNLGVTCIAQTPDGTIYYGTGEGGYTNLSGDRNGSPAFLGDGIYKSTDNRGVSFTKLASTGSFSRCNMMVAHPVENWVWCATENGLYRSINGGTSWSVVRGGSIQDVAIDKDGIVWCANSGGSVYKGNTDGTTFTLMNASNITGGRTSIAISPEDPQYVYIMGSLGGASRGKFAGVWRSTNGGTNWDQLVAYSTTTDVFGSNNQGWYDNVVAVDPTNKNRVYMGGVGMAVWDNVDGFREITSQFDMPWNSGYVHADKHIIQFDTRTKPATMIVGTDGGLFFSQNRAVWTSKNRGFTTLQLYNVAANSLGHIVGGSQDNGSQLINFSGNAINGQESKTAIEVFGGDGFDAEFSKFNPKTIFLSTYYGTVVRTANGGQSTSTFWDKRQDGTSRTDFNTTFTLWEETEKKSRLFLAKDADVWVATNPTDFSVSPEWYLVASGLGNSRIIEMDHTPDGNHLFVAKPGALWRIDSLQKPTYSASLYPNSRDIPAGITKVNILPAAASGRTVTSVNVDQANANHVVITLGGYGNSSYVFETDDALDATPTWKNITANLPQIPVYDAVIDIDNDNRIILATDFGIYMSENGGTTWTDENTGMARVPVFEIRGYEFKPWEGMVLYIGTHGRGYYRSKTLLTNTKKLKDNTDVVVKGYPNPATDKYQISINMKNAGTTTVQVYDLRGALIKTEEFSANIGNNTFAISTANLNNGYYFAKVTQGNTSTSIKFAVNK
ncbi:MAG: T9SS type A sorting domain-containing protein [Bacteroidia bacterium]|nr:T9SS type A sorting domain-containing protein [Bacteroidia bacterium]